MDRHRRLPILEGREVLRARGRDRALRSMIRSTRPPIVSIPSESGMTSRSSSPRPRPIAGEGVGLVGQHPGRRLDAGSRLVERRVARRSLRPPAGPAASASRHRPGRRPRSRAGATLPSRTRRTAGACVRPKARRRASRSARVDLGSPGAPDRCNLERPMAGSESASFVSRAAIAVARRSSDATRGRCPRASAQ